MNRQASTTMTSSNDANFAALLRISTLIVLGFAAAHIGSCVRAGGDLADRSSLRTGEGRQRNPPSRQGLHFKYQRMDLGQPGGRLETGERQ